MKDKPTVEDVAVLYALLATYYPSDLRVAVQNIVSGSLDTKPEPQGADEPPDEGDE